jgi:hypothetical protein
MVAQHILPSDTLEHLSVDGRIPDMRRILDLAACKPGLRSLHVEGTTIADGPPSLQESVQLVTSVFKFVHLRELRIPLGFINPQTMALFGSLPELERLDLGAHKPLGHMNYSHWSGPMPIPGGFPSLVRLGLHNILAPYMDGLVRSGCFTTWPCTVEVSGEIGMGGMMYGGDVAYRTVFGSMVPVCRQVKILRLAIRNFGTGVSALKELSVLQQLEEVHILATEADTLRTAASLWPNARILPVEKEVDVFRSGW